MVGPSQDLVFGKTLTTLAQCQKIGIKSKSPIDKNNFENLVGIACKEKKIIQIKDFKYVTSTTLITMATWNFQINLKSIPTHLAVM